MMNSTTNFTFSTNLHCHGCVEKIKPLLDQEKRISSWQADISSPEKLLTVYGNRLEKGTVKNLMRQAGYEIELFDGRRGFWGDLKRWKRAGYNTLNCLIGCSIGDFGMIIFLQNSYPELSIWVTMGLAMIAGLMTSIIFETILLRIRERFAWKNALITAFSMSFMSMIAMELTENLTDYFLTGGTVPLNDPFYWIALGIALVAGFIVPLPYNYYKLKKFNQACH